MDGGLRDIALFPRRGRALVGELDAGGVEFAFPRVDVERGDLHIRVERLGETARNCSFRPLSFQNASPAAAATRRTKATTMPRITRTERLMAYASQSPAEFEKKCVGWPDNLLSGCGSAQARTHRRSPSACATLPVTSCGFASLRHPDNKLSGPPNLRAPPYCFFSQFTIHDTPNLSTSMPKRCAQNVSPMGMTMVALSESALKYLSASAGVSTLTLMPNPAGFS